MLTLLLAAGLPGTQDPYLVDPYRAKEISALVYHGRVGGHTYLFVIGVGTMGSDRQVIVQGNAAKRIPTTVGGRRAFGLPNPYDSPKTRLTAFAFAWDEKPVDIPRELWTDIFDSEIAPLIGPSPAVGTLTVGVEAGSLIVDLMPPNRGGREPTDAVEVRWRIPPNGTPQREVRGRSSHALVHRIGSPMSWGSAPSTPLSYIATRKG